MRIGMMVDTYKPYVSGITNYIDLNKRALESEGHEVYVFTFGDVDYQDDESRVIRNPGVSLAETGFFLSIRYKRKNRKLLQTMDVIHVHHPFLSGRLALNYCRRAQIPIIFTNHTRYDLMAYSYLPLIPDKVSLNLLKAYLPDFCDAVDLVISPSSGMKDVLRDLNVKSHIEVIPNGVDLDQFTKAKPFQRSDFGFTDEQILLVYVGRVAPEKNINFLVQSFAGIARAIPNINLLIVGGGQKQYEEELQNEISRFGVENRVHLTGSVSYKDVPSYIAMCDIFVTTSNAETFGLSTVEAMSTGLPVVGIHSAGTSDIIEDGVTGFLAEEDMASFTSKLTILCLDSNLRKEMGVAAKKASKQYDIHRTTKTLIRTYKHIVENKKPYKQSFDRRLRVILEEFLR